jgi:hypothetical protein
MRITKILSLCAAACALTACSYFGTPRSKNQILVLDENGRPVADAILLAEDDSHGSGYRNTTQEEDFAPRSGPDGVITADLDEYLWSSDDCYHFSIHKRGFEDTATTVSRELIPQVLKVELRSRAWPLQRPRAAPSP